MSEQIEPCLCDNHVVVAWSKDSRVTAACRVCWYETPSFDTEHAAITAHNRMMRAARGEAVPAASRLPSGGVILARRLSQGITMGTVARTIGSTVAHVSAVERGIECWTADEVAALRDAGFNWAVDEAPAEEINK